MSLAFLTKPIGGSKKDAELPGGPKGDRSRKTDPIRRGGAGSSATAGGAPRVDLMPPEIRLRRSQLRTRRSLRLALFGMFVVVVVACAGTWAFNGLAQTALTDAKVQQQALVAEQAKYSDVTIVKDSIKLIQAGQIVGDSSEIDWQGYLTKLQGTLPDGVTLTTVTVDSATPLKSYAQTTTPLQGGRIATLEFTAASTTLPSIPLWLNGLKTLPGFVDATPGSVALTATGYTADVSMHINADALVNRFLPKSGKTSATTGTDATGTAAPGADPTGTATPGANPTTGGN
jgi:Tfp pilus assembly protein PilN